MRTEPEVEQLVRENLGLVGAAVSRTLRLFPRLPNVYDREDLHCVGSIGLVRAAQTYDPERGATFSTYAYGCIEHAIAGALKRETSRQIECISLSVLWGEEEDSPLEDQIADPEADPASAALHRCTQAILQRAVEELPER